MAGKEVAGVLLMDVKLPFNNVRKAHLGRRMEVLGIESDRITWTCRLMVECQVKLVLDGEMGEASPVDPGIPQGQPVAGMRPRPAVHATGEEAQRHAAKGQAGHHHRD